MYGTDSLRRSNIFNAISSRIHRTATADLVSSSYFQQTTVDNNISYRLQSSRCVSRDRRAFGPAIAAVRL